jgi:2-succinyl-6-hydroxy-2,4-cyclohexadiene-1-carboxylate synthase
MIMQRRTIDVGGIELVVAEAGVGGDPLMLVHGFTGAKEDFADEVDRLAALGRHVVAPDLAGHGESPRLASEEDYGLDRFAADTVALADALGWDRFDLLGHSMGGMVAQLVVLAHPDRIRRLVLMDTHHGPIGGLDPDLLALGVELARTEGLELIQQLLKAGIDPLENVAHQRVCAEREGYETWCDSKMLACDPAMYAALIGRWHTVEDRLDRLRAVEHETLVVVGELDERFVDAAHRMAETLPDATLVVIPDAGHSPQFEATEAWRAAIDGFLVGVAERPS